MNARRAVPAPVRPSGGSEAASRRTSTCCARRRLTRLACFVCMSGPPAVPLRHPAKATLHCALRLGAPAAAVVWQSTTSGPWPEVDGRAVPLHWHCLVGLVDGCDASQPSSAASPARDSPCPLPARRRHWGARASGRRRRQRRRGARLSSQRRPYSSRGGCCAGTAAPAPFSGRPPASARGSLRTRCCEKKRVCRSPWLPQFVRRRVRKCSDDYT